ncbi:ubiquinone anaerobic biosynthesis protein UbiV [Magnetovibrio sp.]|uniref:ubiquinone anaerobic biosynthesis protein UbiV n=1 Tax=Magnetovibrio sp. TaxID=2024836 RepID=UPI002F93C6C1
MNAKLTLGPVLFNWKPDRWRDFYYRIADEADVDTVYVGEAVCSKRAPFYAPHMVDVIERLQGAGKEVIVSTLALIMNGREMNELRDTAGDADLMVEANDVSACALLAGRPHAIGPYVNIYNEGTLKYFTERGATRVCLPVELNRTALAALAADTTAELEVQVFGRLPLAISARCYHARAHMLHKDNCQFVCEQDPDGLEVDTLDHEPFLAVNGVQTMSYSYQNLSAELAELQNLGIHHFRLSPHTVDMVAVAEVYRHILDRALTSDEADEKLTALMGDVAFSNGYFHGAKGVDFV